MRALDRVAAEEQKRVEHLEKTLTDYRAQADRPFEHEARLKELLVRQAQVNAILDLDKGERQVAEPADGRSTSVMHTEEEDLAVSPPNGSHVLAASTGRADVARSASE